MKRTIKKLEAFLCAINLLWMLMIPSFAINSPYAVLLDKGVPKEYLDRLSEEMLLQIYEQIGENNVGTIYQESMELYCNSQGELQPYHTLTESSMTLTTYNIVCCKKDTNIISNVVVAVSWEWHGNKPIVRKDDLISINWSDDLFTYYADSFIEQCYYMPGTEWILYKENTLLAMSKQGGVGFYNALAYSSGHVYQNRGDSIIMLLPTKEIRQTSSREKATSINVEYVHDAKPLVASASFAYMGVGVSIQYNENWAYSVAKSTNLFYY